MLEILLIIISVGEDGRYKEIILSHVLSQLLPKETVEFVFLLAMATLQSKLTLLFTVMIFLFYLNKMTLLLLLQNVFLE